MFDVGGSRLFFPADVVASFTAERNKGISSG